MWITSGSIADVAVIWAKVEGERKTAGARIPGGNRSAGILRHDMHGKWSLRASVTSGLSLQDVRVPAVNLLPGTDGLKSPLMCLNQARYGIAGARLARRWPATIRRCSTRRCGSSSATSRSPVHQLVQEKLVWMITEITKAQLLACRWGG